MTGAAVRCTTGARAPRAPQKRRGSITPSRMLLPLVLGLTPAPAPASTRFFASCIRGLEPTLAAELRAPLIGASGVSEGALGVHFGGGAAAGARAVLWSRSALRVMAEVASTENVYAQPDLYALARSVAWDRLVTSPEQTLCVTAVISAERTRDGQQMRPGDWACPGCGALVYASKDACYRCGAPRPAASDGGGGLLHSHFSALTVKNAACDALREARGWRPSVDTEDADVPLLLHIHSGRATIYRLLSGTASMHKRGCADTWQSCVSVADAVPNNKSSNQPRRHAWCSCGAGTARICQFTWRRCASRSQPGYCSRRGAAHPRSRRDHAEITPRCAHSSGSTATARRGAGTTRPCTPYATRCADRARSRSRQHSSPRAPRPACSVHRRRSCDGATWTMSRTRKRGARLCLRRRRHVSTTCRIRYSALTCTPGRSSSRARVRPPRASNHTSNSWSPTCRIWIQPSTWTPRPTSSSRIRRGIFGSANISGRMHPTPPSRGRRSAGSSSRAAPAAKRGYSRAIAI